MSDNRNIIDDIIETDKHDLESMIEDLNNEKITKSLLHFPESSETIRELDFKDKKVKYKNQEMILTGIDDLLISRGARLILFLPLIVVILFGLAQSFSSF